MGYPDGYYYGQGRIICDTSTFSVGDTIRVRSMTDSSKVWNQQVVTVGTALVFTVPCYDYYKICTVQTINDTPTEIGGVYKTVDYGQTLFINVLDKTTLGGIQGILNAHQETELLNIGDEVDITVNGSPCTMQIAGVNLYDSHEVIFVAKNVYSLSSFNSTFTNNAYPTSTLRGVVQSIFANINETEKAFIKDMTRYALNYSSTYTQYTDKLWIPSVFELSGVAPFNIPPSVPQYQFPLFITQASRVKTYQGTAQAWWDSDHGVSPSYSSGGGIVLTDGSLNVATENNINGVVFAFRLLADS